MQNQDVVKKYLERASLVLDEVFDSYVIVGLPVGGNSNVNMAYKGSIQNIQAMMFIPQKENISSNKNGLKFIWPNSKKDLL